MKHINFGQAFIKMFMLITLCFTSSGFTGNRGLDSYEVYLNDKLVLKQTANQPLNLRVLRLDKAGSNDQLRFIYTHCMVKGAGSDRSIVIKDEKGNTLKKWAFANAKNENLDMPIPVKELRLLEKNNPGHELRLHYTAKELPQGEMLAMLRF